MTKNNLIKFDTSLIEYYIGCNKGGNKEKLACFVLPHAIDKEVMEVLGSAHLFSVLLPMVTAYIGPVAAIEPRVGLQGL